MPFDFQFLTRVQQSTNLDSTTNPSPGIDTNRMPQFWVYNSNATGANEPVATIMGANYFLKANGYFKVGDIIYVSVNDPGAIITFVSASSAAGVTIEILSP